MRVGNCVKQEKCGISAEMCNAHLSNTSKSYTPSHFILYQFRSTYNFTTTFKESVGFYRIAIFNSLYFFVMSI